jgi:hypothetical protein
MKSFTLFICAVIIAAASAIHEPVASPTAAIERELAEFERQLGTETTPEPSSINPRPDGGSDFPTSYSYSYGSGKSGKGSGKSGKSGSKGGKSSSGKSGKSGSYSYGYGGKSGKSGSKGGKSSSGKSGKSGSKGSKSNSYSTSASYDYGSSSGKSGKSGSKGSKSGSHHN